METGGKEGMICDIFSVVNSMEEDQGLHPNPPPPALMQPYQWGVCRVLQFGGTVKVLLKIKHLFPYFMAALGL